MQHIPKKRIINEITKLLVAAEKLIQSYHQLQANDERFLDDLDLPEALLTDFTLTRNLFSIGLDDLGVFTAARGLEGVLRAIAQHRKLTYQVKGKAEALGEADFHDLIEAFARLTLTNGNPVIDKETRSTLQYARTVRNATAHPNNKRRQTARETAAVMANAAQDLWTTNKSARLKKVPLIKNW